MTRAHYATYALDSEGRPISGVTVTVREPGTETSIAETIYAADTGGTTKPNPFSGDADGRIELYLDAPKVVELFMQKVGFDSLTVHAVVQQVGAADITFQDDGAGLTQRNLIDFQEGLVATDDAGSVKTAVDVDWATTEIADISGTAEDDGVSTKVPRADHVHLHPVIASGDLHPEYMTPAEHDAVADGTPHHAEDHAARHASGGADALTLAAMAAKLAGANYFVYKSGSNYIALKLADYTTAATDTDAAVAINAASTALTSGGEIWLEGNKTFNCSTGISLGANVTLRGHRLVGEGSANGPLILAAAAIAGPLVSLDGTGAALTGVTVDAANQATEAVLMNVAATSVRDCYLVSGTSRCLANTASMARQRIAHVRCDGNGDAATAVIELYSTDHLVHDVVATGAGTGNAMIVNGNTSQFSNMHLTGNNTSKEPLLVLGDQNNFSAVTLDTCGSASVGTLLVKGSRNMFSSIGCMNVATGLTRPAIVLQKASAGANCYGNHFLGVSLIDGAQNEDFTGVVKFLGNTGSDPSNLSSFQGTRIHFAAGSTVAISGTDLANVMPTPGDDIDLIGFVSSPSAISVDTRHRFAGARVYKTASQQVLTGATDVLTFDAESYDTDGMHDTVTNNSRVEVPDGMDGFWRVTVTVNVNADGTDDTSFVVSVRKNAAGSSAGGTAVNSLPHDGSTAAQGVAVSLADVVELVAGDYVEVFFQSVNEARNILNGETGTVLSLEYLGT